MEAKNDEDWARGSGLEATFGLGGLGRLPGPRLIGGSEGSALNLNRCYGADVDCGANFQTSTVDDMTAPACDAAPQAALQEDFALDVHLTIQNCGGTAEAALPYRRRLQLLTE